MGGSADTAVSYTHLDVYKRQNQQSATTAELEAANQAIDSAVLNSEYVTEESTGDIII